MQVLLSTYEMNVIAQVESISECTADDGEFGLTKLGLKKGEVYGKCKVSKVEHIVNFTGRILGKQEADYSMTDYVFG